MEEVDKRLLADTLRVSSGSDIDQLLACLSNLRQRPGDETAEKLARKALGYRGKNRERSSLILMRQFGRLEHDLCNNQERQEFFVDDVSEPLEG